MNGRQRRKLRRIWQHSQQGKPVNAKSMAFVVAHTSEPKNICLMSAAEGLRFQDVSIGHRCTSTSHRHYTRKHVDFLIERGDLTWVGEHHKIAAWADHKTWAKVDSDVYAVMQMVRGLRR